MTEEVRRSCDCIGGTKWMFSSRLLRLAILRFQPLEKHGAGDLRQLYGSVGSKTKIVKTISADCWEAEMGEILSEYQLHVRQQELQDHIQVQLCKYRSFINNNTENINDWNSWTVNRAAEVDRTLANNLDFFPLSKHENIREDDGSQDQWRWISPSRHQN